MTQAIANSDDTLCYTPAAKLIARFTNGDVTPEQVLDAQVRRIERLNGQVNAVIATHYEEARVQARESLKRYRTKSARPLEGITVAVKDDSKVEGWINTNGSIPFARLMNKPATEDSPTVGLLRNAGAVLHVQTAIPEFCLHAVTWTRLNGGTVTSTPWNTAYTSGGSSGGAGSALAAGFTTLATGSDIGGSIRIPSAFNGVCGFKPPFGRVPSGQTTYSSQGPMARTVEDLALMQNVLCATHPHDLPSLRPKLEYPTSYPPVDGLKLAVVYPDKEALTDIDDCVRESMEEAIELFRTRLNCTVDEISLDTMNRENRSIFARSLLGGSGMTTLMAAAAPHRDLLCRNTRSVLDLAPPGTVTGADIYKAEEVGAKMHREIQEKIFGNGYTAMLVPTLATPFVDAEWEISESKDHLIINGDKHYGYQWLLTWMFNLLSRYPVVNVPIGLGPKNIPLGMQVVANTYEDLDAFRVASAYFNAAPKLYTGGRLPTFEHAP